MTPLTGLRALSLASAPGYPTCLGAWWLPSIGHALHLPLLQNLLCVPRLLRPEDVWLRHPRWSPKNPPWPCLPVQEEVALPAPQPHLHISSAPSQGVVWTPRRPGGLMGALRKARSPEYPQGFIRTPMSKCPHAAHLACTCACMYLHAVETASMHICRSVSP